MLTETSCSPYAKISGIPFESVRLKPGFWKECFDLCADVTVQQIRNIFERKDISHVVENFRICAGESAGCHKGTPSGDGDFYKWLEGALYCGFYRKAEVLLHQAELYIQLIIKAQIPDGYISTKQIINVKNGGSDIRQKDINEFEIYNFGHLFTLASLHKRLTEKMI